jgi:hypothetical protein
MSNYFNPPYSPPLYMVTPVKEIQRYDQRNPKKTPDLVASINVSIKADNEADYNQAVRDTFERVLSEAEDHQAREAY